MAADRDTQKLVNSLRRDLKSGISLDDVARRNNMSPESVRAVLAKADGEERAKLKRQALVLGGIVVIAVFGSLRSGGSGSKHDAAPAPPSPAAIAYREVQAWDITSRNSAGELRKSGRGRVLLVDSTVRNEADLSRLGQQLHAEVPEESAAHVEVFDDSVAASRRQKGIVQKLPQAQQRHFDRHMIGAYNRNHGTGGKDFWVYGLNGIMNEPITQVDF